jgi:hypothetical protein
MLLAMDGFLIENFLEMITVHGIPVTCGIGLGLLQTAGDL